MPKPKKVAILGAGPSGLITAKTLLHNFPPGTFCPIIFEKNHKVGGLWSVDCPASGDDAASSRFQGRARDRGLVDPRMRTNLSRFSVAFSDLSWESVFDDESAAVPLFPRAWQVGRYLGMYVERYLSGAGAVLRLGCRVLRTVRGGKDDVCDGGRWEVQWINEGSGSQTVESERFDLLIVASGHFGAPYTPDIPGLVGFGNKIHSSGLQNAEDVRRLLQNAPVKQGKVVVIGGSMSGAEAASSLALYFSSLSYGPGSSEQAGRAYEVHHVCTQPFWVLPTYLPHRYAKTASDENAMPFLPLDLVLYDLARRPPGAVEFGFGPTSSEQVSRINEYFRSLLGDDYSKIGGVGITGKETRENARSSWVTIADDYAEYVRSGAINITRGRARAVHCSPSGLARIEIEAIDGKTIFLDDVAAIVTATGFTPSHSLSFLPEEVLSTLEYSENDHFLPLILDRKGSSHADIPDLGFVGFYRGAFWGPMEMQAQSLAERWARIGPESENAASAEELDERARERQRVRGFRKADPSISRGQFPMGDYVGLMESFARELGIPRAPIPGLAGQPGPVVPARYNAKSALLEGGNEGIGRSMQDEIIKTMAALRRTLFPDGGTARTGTAAAVFRALHGRWLFSRVFHGRDQVSGKGNTISGEATFYPRYPSSAGVEKEYLCQEAEEGEETTRAVYRLWEDTSVPSNGAQILVWSVDHGKNPNAALGLVHELRVMPAEDHSSGGPGQGHYVVHAADIHDLEDHKMCRHDYVFHFNGVAISSWERTVTYGPGDGNGLELSRTVYER